MTRLLNQRAPVYLAGNGGALLSAQACGRALDCPEYITASQALQAPPAKIRSMIFLATRLERQSPPAVALRHAHIRASLLNLARRWERAL